MPFPSNVPFLVPWFDRADYPAVRHLLAFGARLPANYDEWLAHAESICAQVKAQNGTVVRVEVSCRTFSKWCREHSRPTNERSLCDFIHASRPLPELERIPSVWSHSEANAPN